MLIRNGIDVCSIGVPSRPGDGLHPADAGNVEDALGDSVDDQHVRWVAHIMVGLDQQHLRVHPGLREVPVGRGVARDWPGCPGAGNRRSL